MYIAAAIAECRHARPAPRPLRAYPAASPPPPFPNPTTQVVIADEFIMVDFDVFMTNFFVAEKKARLRGTMRAKFNGASRIKYATIDFPTVRLTNCHLD